MSGLKIESLELQAFRGVPDVLGLKFASPLTLIYAPNGTGKTTICQAAEWLLTRRVNALGIEDTGEAQAGLLCHFAKDGKPMAVSGQIVTPGGLRGQLGWQGGKWSLLGDNHQQLANADTPAAMLALLAPRCALTVDDGPEADIARRNWLWGARFFSSDALAALLDAATAAQRGQYFSDLLGSRHLAQAQALLEGFGQALEPHIASHQAELKRLNDQLERLRGEQLSLGVGSASAQGLANDLAQCWRLLEPSEAAPIVGLDEKSMRDALGVVEGRLTAGRERLAKTKQAMETVRANWRDLPAHGEMIARLQNELDRLSADLEQLKEQRKQLGIERMRVADRLKLQEMEFNAEDKEADGLLTALGKVIEATGGPNEAGTTSLAALFNSHPQHAWSHATRDERREKVKQLLGQYHRMIEQIWELERLRKTIDNDKQLLADNQKYNELQNELVKKSQQASNLAACLGRISGTIDMLRAAASVALTQLDGRKVCPTCGHDWDSSDKLLQAIQDTARDEGYKQIAGLIEQKANTDEAKNRLESEVQIQNQLRARLAENGDKAGRLERAWNEYEAEVREVSDYNGNDIKARLNAALDSLDAADGLEHIRNDLETLRKIGHNQQPERLTPHVLQSRLEKLRADRAREFGQAAEEARGKLADLDSKTAQRQSAIGSLENAMSDVKIDLAQNQGAVEATENAWRLVAGSMGLTEEAIAEKANQLADQDQALAEAQTALDAAKAQFQWIARQKDIDELDRLRADAEHKVNALKSKRDAAATAGAHHKKARENYENHQVQALMKVVSPLFTRMQVNEVFDGIASGNGGNIFDWRAVAENKKLNSGMCFSQGQRQDLALSIFLARARKLGGTFFLDEPVAHLDDMNRVAMLDIFRMLVVENGLNLKLVLTTSSYALVQHMTEKFENVPYLLPEGGEPVAPLHMFELTGNPRTGVRAIGPQPFGKQLPPLAAQAFQAADQATSFQ